MTGRIVDQNRPNIVATNSTVEYRASALGQCIKALAAQRMGYEPFSFTEDELLIFKEGHLHEDAVLSELEHIIDRQKPIRLALTDKLCVTGHIDGIQTVNGKRYIIEVKTTNKDNFKVVQETGWETPGFTQSYKWQISCYMISLDLECQLHYKEKTSGRLWTLSAEVPFYSLEDIRARVLQIEAYARSGSLPKLCEPGANQWFCKFPYLHEYDAPEILHDDELEQLGIQYNNAVIDVRTAEERKKSLRKAMKQGMGDKRKIVAGNIAATFYTQKRIDYDHAKMSKDGIDVEQYKVVKDIEYFKVKIKENEDEETV